MFGGKGMMHYRIESTRKALHLVVQRKSNEQNRSFVLELLEVFLNLLP